MKACWISKCMPKSLSICTHYVNWYLILAKTIHTWCMQATEKKLKMFYVGHMRYSRLSVLKLHGQAEWIWK